LAAIKNAPEMLSIKSRPSASDLTISELWWVIFAVFVGFRKVLMGVINITI
jgi:hypothetical protein